MRIAILGSTGMLGRYMQAYLSEHYICTPIDRQNICAVNTDTHKLMNIIRQHDIMINCIGIVKPNIKSVGKLNTIRINTIFPEILSTMCQASNKTLIHICTDCVYSGSRGMYNEEIYPDAPDLYARTKSIIPEGASVIRTSFIGEENKKNSTGLLQWILSNKGKEITGYRNAIWNGVTCLQLCKTILSLIQENIKWTGVRHIYSKKPVSKFEICSMVNRIYDLDIVINSGDASVIEGTIVKGRIDRTLSTVYSDIKQPELSLYDQLKEQKKYGAKLS